MPISNCASPPSLQTRSLVSLERVPAQRPSTNKNRGGEMPQPRIASLVLFQDGSVKRLDEVVQLKWLANKAADPQGTHRSRECFLAIGAGQNDFDAWLSFRG